MPAGQKPPRKGRFLFSAPGSVAGSVLDTTSSGRSKSHAGPCAWPAQGGGFRGVVAGSASHLPPIHRGSRTVLRGDIVQQPIRRLDGYGNSMSSPLDITAILSTRQHTRRLARCPLELPAEPVRQPTGEHGGCLGGPSTAWPLRPIGRTGSRAMIPGSAEGSSGPVPSIMAAMARETSGCGTPYWQDPWSCRLSSTTWLPRPIRRVGHPMPWSAGAQQAHPVHGNFITRRASSPGLGTGVRAAGPERKTKSALPFLRRKDKWGHSHSVQRQYILYGGLRVNGKCVYCGGKPIAYPIYGGYIQGAALLAVPTKRRETVQIGRTP